MSTNKDKLNRAITKKAHEIAKENFGYDNAKALMDDLNNGLNSTNDVIRNNAMTRAAEFTNKLSLLILYQEIQTDNGLGDKYSWANMFDDGRLSEGNTKEYIYNIPTGRENWNRDERIPAKISEPKVDKHHISMYKRNAQGQAVLEDGAYQFRKPVTIQAAEWVPYFKSGKLSTFISQLIGYMRECYQMFIVEMLHGVIKNLAPNKVINKTDTDVNNNNLFLAMVNDVIPTIEEFKYYNSDYNYDPQRGGPYAVSSENIVIFANHVIKEKLQSGVMTRLFNSTMIDPTKYINDNNWVSLNKEITVPVDSNAAISTGNDVLNEQTLYIFDKRLIRHLVQIEYNGNQEYISNMTKQHELHIWGVISIVPWFKCVKYTNVNLTAQPN